MKNDKLSRLFLLSLLLLILVTVASAQSSSVLFKTDFDSRSIPPEMTVVGAWEIQSEGWNRYLHIADAQADDSLVLNTGMDWRNYRILSEIRLSSGIFNLDIRTKES